MTLRGDYRPIPGTLVVGIGYKARHGKSTIARQWTMDAPHLVDRFELSDYVAVLARTYYGMTTRDPTKLVAVGQGMRAMLDDEVWLRCAYGHISDRRPPIAVIPNIRFPNEAQLVKQMGGLLVHVTRVQADGTPFVSDDRDPASITETAMDGFDGWDYRVVNRDATELARDASRLLKVILARVAAAA